MKIGDEVYFDKEFSKLNAVSKGKIVNIQWLINSNGKELIYCIHADKLPEIWVVESLITKK